MSIKPVLTGLTAVAVAVSAFAADTVLDVAEGVVFTNTTALVAETANVDKLVKRGKGTYYADCCVGIYSQDGTARKFAELVVEEGTMILHCGSGSFGNCRLGKITVRSGARLRCEIKNGNDALSQFYRDAPSVATVEEGGVFDLNYANISGYLTTMKYAGGGTLRNSNGYHYGQYFTDFTGEFVSDATTYIQPSFGDGSNAGNDIDWTRVRGLVVSNNYYGADEKVRAHFRTAGAHYFDRFPMRTAFNVSTNTAGRLAYASAYFYNSPTFEDFSGDRLRPLLNTSTSHLTINGGRANFVAPLYAQHINITDGASITINGGRFYGAGTSYKWDDRYLEGTLYDGSTKIGLYNPSHLRNAHPSFTSSRNQAAFNMNGGSIYGGDHTKRTWLNGGKVYGWGAIYCKGTTNHTNCWNGAKVYGWIGGGTRYTHAVDRTDSPVTYLVGENGGWYETIGVTCPNIPLSLVWGSACPDGVKDGGMKFFTSGQVFYNALPEFRGPLEFNAYWFSLPSSSYADSDHLFGYGDLVLGGTQLRSAGTSGIQYRLAGGPDAKLVAKFAPILHYEKTTSDAKAGKLIAGPSGATSSSIAREPGGVLFLRLNQDDLSIGTYSTMKVEGGVEKNGAGLPKVPVLQINGATYGTTAGNIAFTDYDTTSGFVPFTGYKTAFGSSSSDVVFLDCKQARLTADTVAGALRLHNRQWVGFVSEDPASLAANVYVTNGVTLTVGDGVNPAAVVMNSHGGGYLASIKGDGTLAFGGSEAVFAINGNGALINCPITADNGITFAGNDSAYVLLYRDQDWTTTVRAHRCRLIPKTNLALGTGKVVLGPGWVHGGALQLSTSGLTLPNAFTLGAGTGQGSGTIVVTTNATLTGDIDFYGSPMINVSGACAELTLAGELSGDDNLEIKNSANNKFTVTKTADKTYTVEETALARDTNGRVIVTGRNDGYQGDVTVVRTTLVLKGPSPGLGTGEIILDAGALRFENTKPVAVKNSLSGAGKVVLASRELVTFGGAFYTGLSGMEPYITAESGYTLNLVNAKDESKLTLEVDSNNAAVASLEGFGEITTPHTGVVHLSVTEDEEGSFKGTVAPNVILHYGLIYRPGFTLLVW